MPIRTVYECDVCGTAATDDTYPQWRRVTIALIAPQPQPEPMAGMALTPAQPTQDMAMVCHKPSCLSKWATEQNKADKADK